MNGSTITIGILILILAYFFIGAVVSLILVFVFHNEWGEKTAFLGLMFFLTWPILPIYFILKDNDND